MTVIKVALPTFDAKTATPEQSALHSDYPVIHIDLLKNPSHFGILNYTWASNPGIGLTTVMAVNHNLGYKPVVFAMSRWEDPSSPGDFYTRVLPEGPASYTYLAYSTSTQAIIAINRLDTIGDLTGETRLFKYYIFSTPASAT